MAAINVITGVTILGVTIGTAALILILSIFNGFSDLVGSLYSAFNPDIKVVPTLGKTFDADTSSVARIKSLDEVIAVSETLEEKALLEYRDMQDVGTVKGVDSAFLSVTTFDSTLRNGYFTPWISGRNQAVMGAGLARRLNINTHDVFEYLRIYLPNRQREYSLDKPFVSRPILPTGIFSFQQEYDFEYVIVPLHFIQSLSGKEGIGALEIKINDLNRMALAKQKISDILGSEFKVIDRYEQDAEFLRLMKTEKWMGFAITSLTILILSFTIIGALWMIVLDKKQDITILRSMGATPWSVRKIFFHTGLLITTSGIVLGVILALVLYALQKQYGLLSLSEGFIVDSYPIRLESWDVLVSMATVLGIGALASILPARKAAEIDTFVRN